MTLKTGVVGTGRHAPRFGKLLHCRAHEEGVDRFPSCIKLYRVLKIDITILYPVNPFYKDKLSFFIVRSSNSLCFFFLHLQSSAATY